MVRFNALAGFILLTGCSGTSVADYIPFGGDSSEPSADAELVGDVDVAEVAIEAAQDGVVDATTDEPGVFSAFLSSLSAPDEVSDAAEVGDFGADTSVDAALAEAIASTSDVTGEAAEDVLPADTEEELGFFASLWSNVGASEDDNTTEIAEAVSEAADEAEVVEAAASVPEDAAASNGLRGLFGFGATPAPPTSGPDSNVIAFGEQIPFGELATVCDMPSNRLGRRIGSAAGFEVYDPIPNSTAQRPHYITGFPDRCVRQFTAALVLMGDVGTHELVRYSSANRRQAYSETDNAYETVKARYCGASRGQPCGSRLDALSDEMTFVSVYKTFGTNGTWGEILLHDGRVLAIDQEDL